MTVVLKNSSWEPRSQSASQDIHQMFLNLKKATVLRLSNMHFCSDTLEDFAGGAAVAGPAMQSAQAGSKHQHDPAHLSRHRSAAAYDRGHRACLNRKPPARLRLPGCFASPLIQRATFVRQQVPVLLPSWLKACEPDCIFYAYQLPIQYRIWP